jgi:hypothetical protein
LLCNTLSFAKTRADRCQRILVRAGPDASPGDTAGHLGDESLKAASAAGACQAGSLRESKAAFSVSASTERRSAPRC